jgi:hypothetical protein
MHACMGLNTCVRVVTAWHLAATPSATFIPRMLLTCFSWVMFSVQGPWVRMRGGFLSPGSCLSMQCWKCWILTPGHSCRDLLALRHASPICNYALGSSWSCALQLRRCACLPECRQRPFCMHVHPALLALFAIRDPRLLLLRPRNVRDDSHASTSPPFCYITKHAEWALRYTPMGGGA